MTSKSFANYLSVDKKEVRILKKITQCKNKKCSKLNKIRAKEEKIFEKEQDKKCQQKSAKAFYDCSDVFYENSKYKTLFNNFIKCGNEKCSKEMKTHKKYRDKNFEKYMKTITIKSV
jgi:hypothetical protein